MSRRSFATTFILIAVAVGVVTGWLLFGKGEADRYGVVQRVLQAPSAIRLSLVVRHAKGPIVEEDYRMADLNGVSSATYRAVGSNGLTIRVESLPRETYDVSFLFEKTVQDGIWELRSKPPRGDTSTQYTITVYQLTDNEHGTHTMTFTDPHYWATTGGRQFHIHLDRNKPVPDLLFMKSTALVEPRYGLLVDDFRQFGSAPFRAKIAAAQARLRAAS
ncbi:MAG TPA: hypothetical protein VME66_10000 [Candidatus Acidoferrales bacterium]|nr:hypothetical protein [Candidatus Acidoferrales bacterium]